MTLSYHGEQFRVSAKVPHPSEEARQKTMEYIDYFDRMEVWWVPKDIKVRQIVVEKDPVLVGVLQPEGFEPFSFELTRWIDEEVEDAYWAKEGY